MCDETPRWDETSRDETSTVRNWYGTKHLAPEFDPRIFLENDGLSKKLKTYPVATIKDILISFIIHGLNFNYISM